MERDKRRASPSVILAIALGALQTTTPSCKDDNGQPTSTEVVRAFHEAVNDTAEQLCQCAVSNQVYPSMDECMAEYGSPELDDEDVACIADAVDANHIAKEILECYIDAFAAYAKCLQGEACTQPEPPPEPFICDDGTTIAPYLVCDGIQDCPGGEDEVDCPDPFVCSNGQEIPTEWLCDGEKDCLLGEDEDGCVETCEGNFNEATDRCGWLPVDVETAFVACNGFQNW